MSETERAGNARTDSEASQTDKIDWDEIGYITASTYRTTAMRALADRPATPSQIAEASGEGIAHISRALNAMRERGLVKLLVSDDRKKGRIYGLTDEGHGIASYLPNTEASLGGE